LSSPLTQAKEILLLSGDETKLHQDVWAVTVLADGTMVTGDSGGNVQFWEAAHGTLVTGFRRHEADVLAVAASPDGGSVFACGADPQVAIFRIVPGINGGARPRPPPPSLPASNSFQNA